MNCTSLNRTQLLGLSFGLLLSLGAAAQQAQKPTPPAMPQFKPTPNDSLISPEIDNDRRVTFHLYAPQAQGVRIRGEWVTNIAEAMKGTDLQRADNGVWSVTVGPLGPGVNIYRSPAMAATSNTSVRIPFSRLPLRSTTSRGCKNGA